MTEPDGPLNGAGRRIAIVVSRFNSVVTDELLAGAVECLERHGVGRDDLTVVRVPGAFELPVAAQRLAARGGVDAIVALGCVIRGETPHFDYVCAEAARGLGAVARQASLPVAFGVLTTDNLEQALQRAGSGEGNKGWEAALSALEMARLFEELG